MSPTYVKESILCLTLCELTMLFCWYEVYSKKN